MAVPQTRGQGGNSRRRSSDHVLVTGCERWREAISAELDGEDPGVDRRLLDAHLTRCPACRSFASAVAATPGRASDPPPDAADLSRRVRKLSALADRAGRWSVVRVLLTVVGVQIVAMSLPGLILGDEQDTAAHAARHLGAFAAAYGVGLLVVAVRPGPGPHDAPRGRRPRRGHPDHRRGRPRRGSGPPRRRSVAPPRDHQRRPRVVAGRPGATPARRSRAAEPATPLRIVGPRRDAG